MPLYNTLPADLREVDVVIAGGGTAACVIASRLADADPGMSILVIEAGADCFNETNVVYPGFFLDHLFPGGKLNATFTGKASEKLGGRELSIVCARTLGGGSSINSLMYARGQASDYDSWDAPGWTSKEFLPYFRKFETYHGEGDVANHGADGPVHISDGSVRCIKAMEDMIRSAEKAGWPLTKDLQSMQPDAINCSQRSLRYVGKDGVRQDVAHLFLHPRLRDGKHPNLHVLVESEVVKILVEQGKAAGVLFRPNPKYHPSPDVNRPHVDIKARKMVVVSCGAFGSPALLERSGIGGAEVLKRAGVTQVVDLPGVGNEYQDHQYVNYAYRTSLGPEETADAVVFGYRDREELVRDRPPMLGHNAQDVGFKIRPTDDELAALGTEFQGAWDRHFKNKPDKPLLLMSFITCFPGYDTTREPGQYMGMSVFNAYPFSRGHVHITGASPSDALDVDSGFLTDRDDIDVKKHVWGYKKQRELMRRMASYRGEFESWHPPFAADSRAACCVLTDGPLPESTPDIEYTAADDAVIERFVRDKVASFWHSMSTCKMAPRERGGVVDFGLGVHGFGRLKVADLSITPGNVAANTASTAIAIGEKAADLFIKELGIGAGAEATFLCLVGPVD